MNTLIEQETITSCYHCGETCSNEDLIYDEKHFCCNGCRTVYEILQDKNLCTYYDLNQHAGTSLKARHFDNRFDYLLDADISNKILDYQSDSLCKVTFYIPAVHCSSCVWLLENFNKIQQGVLSSRLNFLKKELSISYDPKKVSLKEIVELLTTLGYEPLISLDSTEKKDKPNIANRDLILKIGIVGFCMGNIMMMSFPEYFHLDLQNIVDATYQRFFLYFNFVLSLPIFFYGSSDYLKGAWISFRENISKKTNIFSVDIPIAVAIITLYGRSIYETFVNHAAGYYDSLAGLIFFLLVGKWLQQITYHYLSFERNYKSYFPLAVKVNKNGQIIYQNVMELQKGDIIYVHHQELIPADSSLLNGRGMIDYSFVTGESDLTNVMIGEMMYAGGRQMGERLELMVQKPVSQSYLTQLWNNEAFDKEKIMPTTELANLFSKYFTYITFGLATLSGIYWYMYEPKLVWNALTAVLMVACPCALTLSMPFTMSTTMAIFGRNKFYVKNQGVIQLLNEIDTIIFDKTGTLTSNELNKIQYFGRNLTVEEKKLIKKITSQSTHPLNSMIQDYFAEEIDTNESIHFFNELKGSGIEAIIGQHSIKIGKKGFIQTNQSIIENKTNTLLEIDNIFVGQFVIDTKFRKDWSAILSKLKNKFHLYLLSGDTAGQQQQLEKVFDKKALFFNQKPQDKLNFIASKQEEGRHVLMIGDGLNDAGALRQSNVGIAITEDIKVFSPACDAILDASNFDKLSKFIRFSKISLNIVKASFILSLVYNFFGISWAASGQLSPVLAAIFMPLSSISVVLFAVGLTYIFASLHSLNKPTS